MGDETTHEAVVSSLMDLQARLRGDDGDVAADRTAVDSGDPQDLVRVPEAQPIFVNAPDGPLPPPAAQTLSVIEDDVVIEVDADEDEPLRLLKDGEEGHLAPVTSLNPDSTTSTDTRVAALSDRLARLESNLEGVIDRIDKVDPVRIERLEAVYDELGVQHEGLKAKIDSHFTDLQRAIDERIRGTES